ncbi:uncharacterized protein LOC113324797 [Papaver somniferum]|uniref:uncharacterized protein LOC113324797 n=1 Tax=Papaver somniferum TaxID=3469 RepID=UPI000E70445A|nr:uncharacterized protein LOC113324797 [Papaver somniferum]
MSDVDEKCIFCHEHIEILEHLFFFPACAYSKSVWNLPPFTGGINSNSVPLSFKEHYNQWQVEGDTLTETCATKCRFIWKERCNRIFEEKCTSSLQLSITIQRHINYLSKPRRNMNQQTSCANLVAHKNILWTLPESQCNKINYDASWVSAVDNAGYRLILQNDAGEGRAAKSGIFKASCPEKYEALYLLQGAKWARGEGLSSFWLEGDCERMVNFIQVKESMMDWRNQRIVKEATKILEDCSNFLGFKFIHKISNSVADKLAVKDRKSSIFSVWKEDMPTFLDKFIRLDKRSNFQEDKNSSMINVIGRNAGLLSDDHNRVCPEMIT